MENLNYILGFKCKRRNTKYRAVILRHYYSHFYLIAVDLQNINSYIKYLLPLYEVV